MFVTYILSQIRAYMHYRETVRELSHLSDRELNDLGIVRNDIDYIARNSAASASSEISSPPSGGLLQFWAPQK
jgi:uncharacterized protein YjiS (DUF1127 family)